MRVVQDHHQWRRSGVPRQQRGHQVAQRVGASLRLHRRCDVAVRQIQRQQVVEQRRPQPQGLIVAQGGHDPRAQRGGVFVAWAGEQLAHHRPPDEVGGGALDRIGIAAQDSEAARHSTSVDLVQQRRFADSRLALQDQRTTGLPRGMRHQAGLDALKLRAAAHQRVGACLAQRIAAVGAGVRRPA